MGILQVSAPGIACDRLMRPNSTGVIASGQGFGEVQTASLILCTDPMLESNAQVQEIVSWSSSSITFNVNLGSLASSDNLYLKVSGTSGQEAIRVIVSEPDVSVHAGQFIASTSATTQLVESTLPGQPKAIIFWTSGATGESTIAGQGVGFAVGFVAEL